MIPTTEEFRLDAGDQSPAGALREELTGSLGPLFETIGCRVAIEIDGEFDWLTDPTLGSEQGLDEWDLDRLPFAESADRRGFVVCLTPTPRANLRESLRRAIDLVIRSIEWGREELRLWDELAASWEFLEAIYEFSSPIPDSGDVAAMVERVLDRAMAVDGVTHAALWVDRSGQLEPIGHDLSGPIPEALTSAVRDQRSLAINGRPRIANWIGGGPSPWYRAERLLVAPIETRNSTRGVLTLWSDEEGRAYDTRVIRQARALASQAVLAIEADRLNRSAVDHELIRQELEIGSRVQQTLLLANPRQPSSFARVATLAVPSQQVGGDFVETFPQGPDCLAVLIGDVMGKGLKPALVGAAVSRQFHRTLCAMMSNHPSHAPEPSIVVSTVHRDVIRHLLEIESFVTLNYARIDQRSQRLEFVDCGHTPVLHYQRRTGRTQWLGGEAVPLGFRRLQDYDPVSVPFQMGDLFVFYSDGLIDARNAAGESFGANRLASLVERVADQAGADDLPRLILGAINAFAGSPDDDLTCVIVEIVEDSPSTAPILSIELGSDLTQLQDLRSFVRAVCGEFADPPPDESTISELELAMTEAASNVMVHAYDREPDRWIRVEAETGPGWLRFRILHAGRGHDPTASPLAEPALDDPAEGGFGLYLIDKCVDDIHYTQNQCGFHEITLTRGRPGPKDRFSRGVS